MIKRLYSILRNGVFDEDPMSNIVDEITVEFFGVLKGPFVKIINNTLKQYSGINPTTGKPNFSLGVHIKRSDGDVWVIRKQPGAKSDIILNLADEIEENLTRVNCYRTVAIESKPLRVILYHKKLLPVHFSEWLKEIDSLPKNKFLAAPSIHWKGKHEALTVFDMTEEKFCHMLVAGVTGSGKTQLLLSMILSLAINNDPQHLSMLLIDPKGIDFARSDIAKLPHLISKPIVDLDEAAEAIHKVKLELDRRKMNGDFNDSKKGIFIFCDEMASVTNHSQAAVDDLSDISRLGRAWGIHLIIATQRPTSKFMETAMRSQLPCNITGSVTSPEEAKYASGHKESGADRLPGQGAFILNSQQYFNHRIQGLLAGDYGWIVDVIVNEYKGQEAHFKMDMDGSVDMKTKINPTLSVNADSTPKAIANRKAFIDSLIERMKNGEELTDTKVRFYHKEFYEKGIDGNVSKMILEYIKAIPI